MSLRSWRGNRDQIDEQALPRNSDRFRAYARQVVRLQPGVDQLGEWTGGTVKGERSVSNDPVVALAWFLAQTISDGCRCADCEQKRDVVTGLVYGRNVDDRALLWAIETPPAGVVPAKPNPVGRPRKHSRNVA